MVARDGFDHHAKLSLSSQRWQPTPFFRDEFIAASLKPAHERIV
jgi:hypothetical protein